MKFFLFSGTLLNVKIKCNWSNNIENQTGIISIISEKSVLVIEIKMNRKIRSFHIATVWKIFAKSGKMEDPHNSSKNKYCK